MSPGQRWPRTRVLRRPAREEVALEQNDYIGWPACTLAVASRSGRSAPGPNALEWRCASTPRWRLTCCVCRQLPIANGETGQSGSDFCAAATSVRAHWVGSAAEAERPCSGAANPLVQPVETFRTRVGLQIDAACSSRRFSPWRCPSPRRVHQTPC